MAAPRAVPRTAPDGLRGTSRGLYSTLKAAPDGKLGVIEHVWGLIDD